ncbi:MAG: hypothetical protein U9N54_09285 [candidate division Zixibacteria bacterium]|nr:hypothetical protein [candidate division Zixibacteria bacterium]
MKRKFLLVFVVIAFNVFSITTLRSAPNAAPADEYGQILPTRCDCDSGDPGPGDCQRGYCCPEGTEWACMHDIECGEPFYFPAQ